MPLRLPCLPVSLTPGSLLSSYWGRTGYHRPLIAVYAIGPTGIVDWVTAQIDTACD
jgi:hypothetical protein